MSYAQRRCRPVPLAGEETRELDHPQFSRCSLPLLLYPGYLQDRAEFLVRTLVPLHALLRKGWVDRR